MPAEYSANKKAYNMKYQREKLKRIPLDVQLSEYETIKAAALAAGETVNGYIKAAVRARIAAGAGADVAGPGIVDGDGIGTD